MSIHGEGDIRIQVQKRVRIGCDNCGEPATKRISYCYVNGRSDPASSMYRRDDCTYCSDAQAWACDECEREVERVCAPDGMQWASTTTLSEHNASTFLRWEDRDSAAVAELIEAARTYFNGYCVDEAEDDFEDSVFGLNTGCTPEQHEDAKRLRAALANVGGQP